MSSLIYFFKESLTGFTRNLGTTLGSIITIFLSLFIIGLFLVSGAIVNNIVLSVEDKVSITAYIGDEAEQEAIDAMMATIEGMDGVESVNFTSKEQALENFRNSTSSNPEIVDQLDGMNPLPASIDIELDEAQEVEDVVAQIQENPDFQAICDSPDNPADSLRFGGQETVERLFSVTNYIRYIGIALIALLVFIALVFINNTIRLAILARRREIGIMRLVGASNGFIRGPFLMEASLHAVIGAVLAIGCLEVIRRIALPHVSEALMWLPIELSTHTYLQMYLLLVVAGLIIAGIGCTFAMGRYLKV
ncbi:permease-like cell division protein FtsX [Slackia heliotrinireducens]|uniref:Cell division protein FtsX n=1 Tax=Slackia heliotrinireducens (strain ATCC 29202 / DSM 20476 / NCTC 11029 / RHS 1) TaxID=471855 RepID=C7N4W5_SLAHD|nr:permease-like cell division protein FtsX [Slackia heliotrinireducens]ACV21950.1 cell division protein [Slackia heliotrinireducens DSM 20476]VEG99798.1 Cell division protein FtsX [Slackia heliotrinireducens]